MLFILSPGEVPMWPCLFHDLTGYSCFACGLTRSLHAVAEGHLLASLQFHLLGPFLFAGMLFASVVWSVEAITGRTLRARAPKTLSRILLFSGLTAWTLYGLLRIVLELSG